MPTRGGTIDYNLSMEIRWMPDGEEDLSWPWIKEALPPIQLTKVLPRLTHHVVALYGPPLQCHCVYANYAGHLRALNDPGHPFSVQSCFFGRL